MSAESQFLVDAFTDTVSDVVVGVYIVAHTSYVLPQEKLPQDMVVVVTLLETVTAPVDPPLEVPKSPFTENVATEEVK
jgi:hypothetical protein